MAWADIDRDGDLDLLTGSYDLELKALLEEAFEGQTNSGVYWHERRESQFHSHLLALHSQGPGFNSGTKRGWREIDGRQ